MKEALLWTPAWGGLPPLPFTLQVPLCHSKPEPCSLLGSLQMNGGVQLANPGPGPKCINSALPSNTSPVFISRQAVPVSLRLETGLPPSLWAAPYHSISAVGARSSSQGFLRNGFEIQRDRGVSLEWRSTSSVLGQIWI